MHETAESSRGSLWAPRYVPQNPQSDPTVLREWDDVGARIVRFPTDVCQQPPVGHGTVWIPEPG